VLQAGSASAHFAFREGHSNLSPNPVRVDVALIHQLTWTRGPTLGRCACKRSDARASVFSHRRFSLNSIQRIRA